MSCLRLTHSGYVWPNLDKTDRDRTNENTNRAHKDRPVEHSGGGNMPTKAANLAAICIGSLSVMSMPAQASEPTKPIEIIVPAGTGGGADQMARMMQGIIT